MNPMFSTLFFQNLFIPICTEIDPFPTLTTGEVYRRVDVVDGMEPKLVNNFMSYE